MAWAVVIREADTKRVLCLCENDRIDSDDPRFENEVHFVPCLEDGDGLTFGVHDFTKDCCCGPKVEVALGQRDRVIHRERHN